MLKSASLLILRKAQLGAKHRFRQKLHSAKFMAGITFPLLFDIYGKQRVQIPEPDFVLVYTETEKLDEYRSLKLSDLYMENEKHKLELVVDVFSGTEDEGNILCQYIGFCRKFDELKKDAKMKDEKLEALRKTIAYCKEHDILKEFLKEHEMEVFKMRMSLYTQEEIDAMKWDRAVALGRNEGISIGEARGVSLGRSEGLREGLMSTARKMLALGSEVAFVQKATGLSMEEIEKLK